MNGLCTRLFRCSQDALPLQVTVFGVGWAVGGYCPGPGLVSAASLAPQAMAFVSSMTMGMLAFQLVEHGLAPKGKLVGDA